MSEPQVTLEDIIESTVTDTRHCGPDGCSNYDRVVFLQRAFGVEEIDLSMDFDFSPVIEETNPIMICGAKHLALLKLDYVNRLYEHMIIDQEDYDSIAPGLILAIRRIDHHLRFAEEGLPAPPFSIFE